MNFSLNKNLEHSSIFDDIRFALSSRPVILILALSALFRIAFHFYVLPNSPSGFGPDEGTYAALAIHVSEGLPVEEFPTYGAGLYHTAKSIILPSALLIKLGMAELMAVRTIASVYGLASSLLLVLCFLTLVRLRGHAANKSSLVFDRKFLALLLIFTFFPSNFVWSTIGLRESGSQFWLITTFYLILKLLDSTGKDSWKFTALSSIALALAHGARPETALVFSLVALITSIVLLLKFRKFLPVIAILIGVLGGYTLTTTPQVGQVVERNPVTPQVGQVVERNPLHAITSTIQTLKILEYKRKVNALNAESALPADDCQGSSSDILPLIECTIGKLPYHLFAFLFRPLVFFDQGSTALTYAALENLGWMILIPLSIWVSLRKGENVVDRFINLSLISYVIVFALAAALYEGNLGTAFRHKSTILWPIVFILMISPRILPKLKTGTNSLS